MEQPAEQLASHHTWLRRMARRMVRSAASADDLVQDTCITALRNAPPDVQMRPWLRSVMRKLAWGQVRSEERRAQREESFYQTTPPTSEPDALLEYGVDRERLAQAVETLPEPFRSTVVQRFVEGRSCAEIARDEKVPAGTVRWRQARALELLRSELDGARVHRRRRRHVFWGLPLAGVGERIASHVSQSLVSFAQSKAAWFVAACVVAALGLGLLRGSPDQPHADTSARAAAEAHHAAGAFLRALRNGQRGQSGDTDSLLTHGVSLLPGSGPFSPDDAQIVSHDVIDPDERRERRRLLEAIKHRYEPYLDDCELDSKGLVRCDKPPSDPNNPGRPTCESINHNLAFIDITRRLNFMSHPYANRFLLAAMVANLTLGTSLGCTLVTDSSGTETRNVLPSAGSDCTTQIGPDGEVCATCTDPDGAETTMCAPSDCYAQTMPDGADCTTCTDIHGNEKTICEEAPPKDCVSEITGFGLLCTTCTPEGREPEITCSAAQCVVSNYCLECTDPKGNTATDCSQNYEEMPAASSSIGGGDTFNNCGVIYGMPTGTATTWHYPGLETCTVAATEDWYSIECRFPDGGGVGVTGDREPNAPLPNLFAGRPENLPAPGACVDNTSADGAVFCTTCTRDDLSATTTCRHPAAQQCEPMKGANEPAFCVQCSQADGSSLTVCDPTDL